MRTVRYRSPAPARAHDAQSPQPASNVTLRPLSPRLSLCTLQIARVTGPAARGPLRRAAGRRSARMGEGGDLYPLNSDLKSGLGVQALDRRR